MIFTFIPFLAAGLRNKKVLIIDELDKSLHPFLVQYIVEIFNDAEINKNGSQLIFNTHDTNLLDLNILRRDQIWFTEKNKETGEVPMHIRNAPIEKMEELGYHQGYLYPHDYPGNYIEQQYLPDIMLGTKYYISGENDQNKINPNILKYKKHSGKEN